MRFSCLVGPTIAALMVQPESAAAQTTSSTLRGHVQDAQHAAVPAASATVLGRANGIARNVTTYSGGDFTGPNLPPGVVDVTAAARDFTAVKRSGVVLEVGQVMALDIELSVGPISEAISVVASPAGLERWNTGIRMAPCWSARETQ